MAAPCSCRLARQALLMPACGCLLVATWFQIARACTCMGHTHNPILAARSTSLARRVCSKTCVQVLLNSRVLQSADGTLATEAGQDLPADLVYFCTGGQPNSDFMRTSFGACLDRDHHVKVPKPGSGHTAVWEMPLLTYSWRAA